MFAPVNEPVLNSDRSSIGSRWRCSSSDERDEQHGRRREERRGSPASSSRAGCPRSARSVSANRPRLEVTRPGMSTLCSRDVSRDSLITSQRDDDPEDPDRHVDEEDPVPVDRSRRSAPPTSGPIASAIAETPAQMPIAWPRSRGGNVAVMIESDAGFISAAPTPWTTRAPIRKPAFGARPQASDGRVKIADPDDEDQLAARTGRRACRP